MGYVSFREGTHHVYHVYCICIYPVTGLFWMLIVDNTKVIAVDNIEFC